MMSFNWGAKVSAISTGNLDPKTGDQVLELLLEMNRVHGTALVVVTHSPSLAARLGRRTELVEGMLEELPGPV